MKNFLLMCVVSTSCTQIYSQNNDYYCFSSGKNNILLISSEYPNIQSIKYFPYLKNIKISKPIKVVKEDMGDNAKPEIYRTMNEIVNGKVTGQYKFMSQGYLLYDVSYMNLKSKKTITFTKSNLNIKNINCL